MSKALFSKIESLKKQIDRLRPLHPDLVPTLREKLNMEWIYNSNAIEGNTLTLGETVFFLREGLTSEGKPLKDFLEAKNHAEALEGLEEILRHKRPLTESLIKELHSVLLRNIEHTQAKGANGQLIKKPLHPGKYKTRPNHVLTLSGKIHHYCDPIHVQDEMEKLVAWNQKEKKLSAVQKAALFHYRFVSIHPFDDGNGRMARILMNLILMQNGYPPCIVRNTSRRKYLQALSEADTSGDTASFVTFVAEELLITLQSVHEVLVSQKPRILNHEEREQLILDSLNHGAASVQQLQALLHEIKRPTLKSDLQRLVLTKKIKKSGVGKGTIYRR